MSYRAGWLYDKPLLTGAQYDSEVTTPESLLGFPVGFRAASPSQVEACIQTWAGQSPKAQLHEYARSYEARALYYLVITSEKNMSRLDAVKSDILKLADPRKTTDQEAERLLAELPGVAWLAYSIHGNESSGSDAALGVIYHLLADQSRETQALLDDIIIIVDPMMNPDGRARFCQKIEEQRGASPNFDSQSLLHKGEWPGGRTNHYYFDLNRDFILGVNPETRGRVKVVNQWNPQLFVDAHEMGALSTYLFSPSRAPINLHMPPQNRDWGLVFGRDQARSFDQKGWTYFTGEWNDEWYPGYSFWCSYRGSLTILYEQARIHEDAIKHPEGTYHSYQESVHHQLLSSMVNLSTLHTHFRQMRRDAWKDRKLVLSPEGPYARKTWVLPPTGNAGRLRKFLDTLDLQGFEYYRSEKPIMGKTLVDQLGRASVHEIPAGSIFIPNLQPQARLLGTMMEFDPRIPEETLMKERQEVITKKSSIMYDTTGWSLSMLFDLEAWLLKEDLPSNLVRWQQQPGDNVPPTKEPVLAWVISGLDDSSLKAAAQLMQAGYQVRTATKDFEFESKKFSKGSILILNGDNPGSNMDVAIHDLLKESGVHGIPVQSGWGEGDLPDLGGRHFPLLIRPQIALVGHGRTSSNDFGSIWHSLDKNLGIRHSHLSEDALKRDDLRRYNVIILPDRYGPVSKGFFEPLLKWVEAGGTLITIGGSSEALVKSDLKDVKTRLLEQVLEKLDDHEVALYRQWMMTLGFSVPKPEIWNQTVSVQANYPWSEFQKRPDKDELKKRDIWDQAFMPQGVLLATQVDPEHWLGFGCREYLPVMFSSDPVLMTTGEAPFRFGFLNKTGEPVPAKEIKAKEKNSTKVEIKPNRAGWATLPPGYELRLRMSGLLWPEAARRIANGAWASREVLGQGQIIMFASSPNFRGATYGTNRVLLNALVLGPGLGSSGQLSLD